jgi:hypothetical protein
MKLPGIFPIIASFISSGPVAGITTDPVSGTITDERGYSRREIVSIG